MERNRAILRMAAQADIPNFIPIVLLKTPKTLEAPGGFEPPNGGFADLCLTTWLRRLRTAPAWHRGRLRAGHRTRTGDLLHGKQTLYQLS